MLAAKRVVVTGGAGYLGSCVAAVLKRQGVEPILFDNFSTSKRPAKPVGQLIEVDLGSKTAADKAFDQAGTVDAVIHFAAFAIVPQSCEKPGECFRNNLVSAINVAENCGRKGIPSLLHSSSCAVYGNPTTEFLAEDHPLKPFSPYGESKKIVEQILGQFSQWKKLRVLNLRYFNPAGALPAENLGEAHDPETHLIPLVVEALRQDKPFSIYGNEFLTPDGTCIRDFLHVSDLAEAHIASLAYLEKETYPVSAINVGSGRGYSVQEVIATAEKIFGKKAKVAVAPPRPGDPSKLIATNDLAKKILGWNPKRTLSEMISDHLSWVENRSLVE